MNNSNKLILDLCGGTGAWSQPYKDAGYEVIIHDIDNDVRLVEIEKLKGNVYGVLAAPPCTVFASSGARWKRTKEEMIGAISIVDACIRIACLLEPMFWALENPVGKLRRYIGSPKMMFNPCDYGDPYTKKTLIWGDFNIPLRTPVEPVEKSPIHYMPPSKDRAKLRSITPPGFAQAFYKANK